MVKNQIAELAEIRNAKFETPDSVRLRRGKRNKFEIPMSIGVFDLANMRSGILVGDPFGFIRAWDSF
jgi:hypothetical protein